MSYAAPAPPAGSPAWSVPPTVHEGADVTPLLARLQNAAHPSEQEAVVHRLAHPGGPGDPRVVAALLVGARSSRAPNVRAACLRALVVLKNEDASLPALATRAQADPDPGVRAAAGQVADWLHARGR